MTRARASRGCDRPVSHSEDARAFGAVKMHRGRAAAASASLVLLFVACTTSSPPLQPSPIGSPSQAGKAANGMLIVMKVTLPPGPRLAGFVPPGTSIGTEDVYLVRPGGTGLKWIYSSGHTALDFARGGPRIVFAAGWTGGAALYDMNADGSGLRKIVSSCHCSALSVSPDGTRIAFDYKASVYVMDSNGTSRHQLTSCSHVLYPGPADRMHCAWLAGSPTWSPDGTKVAYAQAHFSGGPSLYSAPGLNVMNADGSDRHGITRCADHLCPGGNTALPLGVNDPAWSPLGDLIAYVSGGHLFTIRSDGKEVHRLPGCPTEQSHGKLGCQVTSPMWSPDSKFIAYENLLATAFQSIVVMGADGTGAQTVRLPKTPRVSWQLLGWAGS